MSHLSYPYMAYNTYSGYNGYTMGSAELDSLDQEDECTRGARYVTVPQVYYTLHRKPVVYESLTKHVGYVKVPVRRFYRRKTHPTRVVKTCGHPRPCSCA